MTDQQKEYPADVKLFNLYERKSKMGNQFFTGKVGAARYSLIKTKFTSDNGEPVWELKVSAAPKTNSSHEYKPQPLPQQKSPPMYDDFSNEFDG